MPFDWIKLDASDEAIAEIAYSETEKVIDIFDMKKAVKR